MVSTNKQHPPTQTHPNRVFTSTPISSIGQYRPGARNDWFRLLQPEDRVIVSEHLSYQEPRLSDGLRHYHGDELNNYDDHEEEEDDELEEIIEERRRNSVNRDEGFRAMYRERFNESNYDNSVREDPSSYERRIIPTAVTSSGESREGSASLSKPNCGTFKVTILLLFRAIKPSTSSGEYKTIFFRMSALASGKR